MAALEHVDLPGEAPKGHDMPPLLQHMRFRHGEHFPRVFYRHVILVFRPGHAARGALDGYHRLAVVACPHPHGRFGIG
ncbi:hypothetical protein D3C72_2288210 [compost metagenome]